MLASWKQSVYAPRTVARAKEGMPPICHSPLKDDRHTAVLDGDGGNYTQLNKRGKTKP